MEVSGAFSVIFLRFHVQTVDPINNTSSRVSNFYMPCTLNRWHNIWSIWPGKESELVLSFFAVQSNKGLVLFVSTQAFNKHLYLVT